MMMVDIILGQESEFKPLFLCDIDGNNIVTVSDVMKMVDMVLMK